MSAFCQQNAIYSGTSVPVLYKKLITFPDKYGSQLRHNLKSYWKIKVSGYRVIYKIEKEKVRKKTRTSLQSVSLELFQTPLYYE